MPSCVVVARGTLDPLALVRIQARQPFRTVPEPLVLEAIRPKKEGEPDVINRKNQKKRYGQLSVC